MEKIVITFLVGIFFLSGCQKSDRSNQTDPGVNPAAEGFNAEASDSTAITIADSVMKAVGGRKNWDQTKIISWNFFGQRTHTWNKHSGRDSINIPDQQLVIDMNMQSKEGTVFKNGAELTQPDSLQKYLKQGYEMWVNDMYWLLMPFKLKDSGVTLKYAGLDSTASGRAVHKLEITFDSVGVTPQNKYHVYVDTADHLVRQWAYYPEAGMEEPGFVLPWKNYKQLGNILLSGNRGKSTISNIKVMDKWPE